MTTKVYDENDVEEVTNLLVGRKVSKVSDDTLLLDDGTLLRLEGNEGCGGCSNGYYDLSELNEVDNIITAVELEYTDLDKYGESGVYKIFVYADNTKINLATFEGGDGNGYYGTGYYIHVTVPD